MKNKRVLSILGALLAVAVVMTPVMFQAQTDCIGEYLDCLSDADDDLADCLAQGGDTGSCWSQYWADHWACFTALVNCS